METWLLILISLCISAVVKSIFNVFYADKKSAGYNLPPSPSGFPIIGNFLTLRKSSSDLELILRSLHAKLGPIVTLRLGSRPFIFVADHSLSYQALVQHGAVFADRPSANAAGKIFTCNQHNINSASYGPNWRLLRRNLTAEILNPLRVKSFSRIRNLVLRVLLNRLESDSISGQAVRVKDHLQYAMFCLLVFMCFGENIDEKQIKEVKRVQQQMILRLEKFNILNFWPAITKIVLRRRWEELYQTRKSQEDVLIPLIKARHKEKDEQEQLSTDKDDHLISYVDTFLDLELPEENRKLSEGEMVSLCSEFLNAGTDTTSTALEWIMANLVKHPQIQEKLFAEIKGVVGDDNREVIKEEELQNMPYLKAVIYEGLRRHPPAHFVLPHAVTKDTVLDKYLIPKNAVINFMVAEMGHDAKVWDDPMAFKPERFLHCQGEAFDITGSKEIKMMPFGVGRRICLGYGLAMLHLEYFVANLIWRFKWKPLNGDDIDLSEKLEFTVVMKNPLQTVIAPRFK